MDGTYSCRVKHNAVEKGLTHSPDVNVNMIESFSVVRCPSGIA